MRSNFSILKHNILWTQVPLILLFISLFYLRFLTSIAVGLMAVVCLYQWILSGQPIQFQNVDQKRIFLILISLFAIVVLDVLRQGPHVIWWQEVALKFTIVVVPWYLLSLQLTMKNSEKFLALFQLLVVFTGILSVFNYALNFDEINAQLLHSKHVPIIGGTNHIYFGIFLTLTFWTALYYGYLGNFKKFWRGSAAVIALIMHILVSRTGLVAFYISLFCFLIWLVWVFRFKRVSKYIVIAALVIPVLSYQFSTSFRNKIENSVEDYKALSSGEDINFKSLAMRYEAWKTSVHLISKNPVFGTGIVQFDVRMQQQYALDETTLYSENRIGPHNQLLESGVKYGLVSMLLIIVLFLVPLRHFQGQLFMLLVVVIFIVVFQLESLLERQLGMVAFGLFYMLSATSEKVVITTKR